MKTLTAVPEDAFVLKLREEYSALDPSDRIQKIRDLISESSETAQFIQVHFPDFLSEVFPPSFQVDAPR